MRQMCRQLRDGANLADLQVDRLLIAGKQIAKQPPYPRFRSDKIASVLHSFFVAGTVQQLFEQPRVFFPTQDLFYAIPNQYYHRYLRTNAHSARVQIPLRKLLPPHPAYRARPPEVIYKLLFDSLFYFSTSHSYIVH